MINLDSTLKSKEITFPTKVRLVKAMVFPVAMYRCENWCRHDGWSYSSHIGQEWMNNGVNTKATG